MIVLLEGSPYFCIFFLILTFLIAGLVAMQQKAAKAEENCLRRRQSLPAVPAALLMPGRPGSKGNLLKSIDKLSVVARSKMVMNYELLLRAVFLCFHGQKFNLLNCFLH